jgi:hypothetical protein
LKKGKPFCVSSEEGNRIISHITEMQITDFESSVTDERRRMFHIVKKSGREKNPSALGFSFDEESN